jgi:hypothetical protein
MAKGWSINPTKFIDEVEKDLTDLQKEIAISALQSIISGSPVDKGTYKGNHRVTVDASSLNFDSAKDDPSGSSTLSEGAATIGSIAGPYHNIIIQNNAPYGERLENGHSQQAPGGVYGVAFIGVSEKYRK